MSIAPRKYPAGDLDQLKRQAKELKRSVAGGDAQALVRIQTHMSRDPSPTEPLPLRDAQHVLAREYGFGSWGDLLAWHGSDSSQLWRRITATRDGRVTDLRRTLEDLHEPHAQLLMSTLSRHVGRPVRVDVAYVDCTWYGEYIKAVSQPACGWAFEADGFAAPACLDIGIPMAHRLLGDRPSSDGLALDDSQVARLEPVARQILEDLQVIFQPAGRVRLRQMRFHENPADMNVAHANDVIYLVGYEIADPDSEPGDIWSLLSLAFPVLAITELLETVQRQMAA